MSSPMRGGKLAAAIAALVLSALALALSVSARSFSVTAPVSQADPAIAFDGTNYFVVWDDERGGPADIYGARVSPAGLVLDTDGFPVSVAPNAQGTPSVAFGAGEYFVAWTDSRNNAFTYSAYGARVTPAAVLLDPTGIRIVDYTSYFRYYPRGVAFDGVHFLVPWQDVTIDPPWIDAVNASRL